MKKWKRLVSATVAACLLWGMPAQATVAGGPSGTSGGQSVETEAPSGAGQSNVGAQVVDCLGDGPGNSGGTSGTPGATGTTGDSSTSGPTAVSGGSAFSGAGSSTDTNTGASTGSTPGSNTGSTGTITGVINTNITSANIAKPEVQSQDAVLMDVATGNILYERDSTTKCYPASITKLMTALLIIERCSLGDTVTFSAKATTNLEAGMVSLNITEGDKLTVRQCLYALLLKSANEVANGLAEHVAGNNEAFAKLMNEKAATPGCTNTNFANPHGLDSSNHYTTAKDMALIARAAFQNDALRAIDTTLSHQFPATKKEKVRTLTMGHKVMYFIDSRYYPDITGGKTGYTSLTGNTLVTAVEKNGVRLIAVILKSKDTHYADTRALLDYGFEVMKTGGTVTTSATTGSWKQDSTGWYYIKSDGSRAFNEWQIMNGEDYWFDSNAYMATGRRQFSNGFWYYSKPSGTMTVNKWAENKGKWFYLGVDDAMLKNTTTPDGYRVDDNGVRQS